MHNLAIRNDRNQSLMPINSLRRQVNNLFSNFFDDFGLDFYKDASNDMASNNMIFRPHVDIWEDDKAYYIEAELAGVKKEDIKLGYKNNMLTIEAKKEERKEDKSKKNYYCSECSYGSFYRNFSLPEDVSGNKIDAEMKNGMLKITIPKSEERKAKETEINIR